MFSLPRSIYPIFFVVGILAAPLGLFGLWPSVLGRIAAAAIVLVWYGLNVFYCRKLSRPEIGLLDLFTIAVAGYCSGCINITIIYIWIPLLFWYLAGWFYIIVSLRDGKDPSAKFATLIIRPRQPNVYFPEKTSRRRF